MDQSPLIGNLRVACRKLGSPREHLVSLQQLGSLNFFDRNHGRSLI